MDISFTDFGKIREGIISINGLTVIAGENNTGKSTVGKALYSVIYSVKNFKNEFERLKNTQISFNLSQLIFELLKIRPNKNSFKEYRELLQIRSKLYDSRTYDELYDNADNIMLYISSVESYIKDNNVKESIVLNMLNSIKDQKSFNADNDYKLSFVSDHYFSQCFRRQYNNAFSKKNSKIIFSLGCNEQSTFIFNDKASRVRARFNTDDLIFSFSDAILIDSPFYLEQRNSPSSIFGKNLRNKLQKASEYFESSFADNEIINAIEVIFNGGYFKYNDKFDSWTYFVSEQSTPLYVENIATGTKILGIVYILLKSCLLTYDSVLIFDEPENHLHPSWQIAFAKIIVLMVSKGYHILLTSHSPTFIHALAKFSKRKLEKNKYNFYLSESVGINECEIKNCTNNLDFIFNNLVSPDEKLFME